MLSCRPSTKPVSGLELLRNTAKRRAYSHKVRAFPFAVSKEKAIADLSWNTAAFTGEKVPGTFLRHLLPSLNVDALQPIRAVPVYLPTWVIDAEAEVTVWSKKQESDDHFVKDTAQVQFAHSDMPGFAYGPLSNFSFMNPRLLDAETVRWSEDLRKHEGEDVICVPFSLSPFKLPDAARSLSMADASVADVLRFEPSSVKETVLAGYPVLLPGYLAQYKVENAFHGKVETVSAFIEAGVPRGRAVVEVLPAVRDWFNMFNVPVGDVFVRGPNAEFVYEFTNARSLIGNHISLKHRHLVEQWLDRAVVRGQAIEKYRDRFFGTSESAAARNVDWSDIRIRPFDLEERHANLSWLKSGANLFLLRTMLQVYNSKREVRRAL
ncbi:hypothetical protein BV20DRAFT_1023823 [Pilatotrama ljubarskyi]|nr:hypothetical protein BV20DRAFT_1023823 [Pilatotrama ljubarskyi]